MMMRFAQTWTDWPVTSLTGSVLPQLALPAHSKNVGLSLKIFYRCVCECGQSLPLCLQNPNCIQDSNCYIDFHGILTPNWAIPNPLRQVDIIFYVSGTGTCVAPVFELFKLKVFSPPGFQHAWCMLHRPHTDLCIMCVSTQGPRKHKPESQAGFVLRWHMSCSREQYFNF